MAPYRFVGKALPRTEDARLVRGLGRFTGDLLPDDRLRLFVVRSPHPSALIRSIETRRAEAIPGVRLILTGTDPEVCQLGCFSSRVKRFDPDGSPNFEPPYRVLTTEKAQFVGDAVAAVYADSLGDAQNAAEAIEIDWEPLSAVTDVRRAVDLDAAQVWPEAPRNICFVHEVGNSEQVAASFDEAKHQVSQDYTITRIIAAPLETRCALAYFDNMTGNFTLHASLQNPHYIREELADRIFRIPGNRLRVVSPDVGGAFGLKESPFPEYALALIGASRTGRPVSWIEERSESFLADHHARDCVCAVRLALGADGRFLALGIRTTAAIGAYIAFNGLHSSTNNLGGLTGVYRIPAVHAHVTGVFTHTSPTSPYRGAGRPEATYAIERIIDLAAARCGFDRVELRRRNMIDPTEMPYDTGFIYRYDSGEFERNMDTALKLADWRGFERRREDAKRRGKLAGIGLANAIEIAAGPAVQPFSESAEIRFDSTGSMTVTVGTHSHGQGHETTFPQIIADALGVEPEEVRLRFGDTDQIDFGVGTFGSRSAVVVSVALITAVNEVVARGKVVAAAALSSAPEAITFHDGAFRIEGTNQSMSLKEVARASFRLDPLQLGGQLGLGASVIVGPSAATFPNSCQICEVEIDVDTGKCEVVRYCVVDDVGRVVNPMIVKGQIHGGVAQGIGQALLEQIAFDVSGQLTTGSFMDYAMPRANDLCKVQVQNNEVPTGANPLGIKGAGEAGVVGSLVAAINAVADALSPLGIDHVEMPATSERLWQFIQEKKCSG